MASRGDVPQRPFLDRLDLEELVRELSVALGEAREKRIALVKARDTVTELEQGLKVCDERCRVTEAALRRKFAEKAEVGRG